MTDDAMLPCCCLACDPVSGEIGRVCSRPTPQTVDEIPDALEKAMVMATEKAIIPVNQLLVIANAHGACLPEGEEPPMYQALRDALTAAAAMGYTLAPDEQTLPELPEGYLMSIDFHRQQDDSYMYSCFLMKRGNLIADDRPINLRGTGPTLRAAVLAAIRKIDGGKG